MTGKTPARNNRRPLLLLLLLFAAPLGGAFLLYYGSGWRPASHTNHGQLIVPVVPVPGAAFTGKWSLVVIGAGEAGCDASCQGALIYARQTWLSLGKLTPRAQRVLLGGEGCCDRAYLQREHAGLLTLPPSEAGGAALRQDFPAPREHAIYVVDPLGNLMMRYDVRDNPSGLRDDLKKLLELSHIG
ncbi:MAG TPA: hypothetical protein VK130_01925 [Steroidobacteraceae bacterium]|nr:hypothetical protein [Steroidobacteraceae bacterium]